MTEPNILMGHKLQIFQDWGYKISDTYKNDNLTLQKLMFLDSQNMFLFTSSEYHCRCSFPGTPFWKTNAATHLDEKNFM
jgi:hypothetical protein